MAEIITPENSRWDEFVDRLKGPDGCGDSESVTCRCDHSVNKPFAQAILKKMGGIDIDATLKYFEEHGGYCDCEILFNVDPISED